MGELFNADLEVVPISAEQAYMVCGRAKQSRLRSGSYLSGAAYIVCGRAKQSRLKSGSYLSRASIHGLWES